MFIIKKVRVLACEEKPWEIDGKKGLFYPTSIRLSEKIFNITSKVDLRPEIDKEVNLELELQSKTPKSGNPYTGIRILGVEFKGV